MQGNGQYEVHNNAVWISGEHCTEKYFHVFFLKGLKKFCLFNNISKLHVEFFVFRTEDANFNILSSCMCLFLVIFVRSPNVKTTYTSGYKIALYNLISRFYLILYLDAWL